MPQNEMKINRWRLALIVGALVVLAGAIAVFAGALIAHDQVAAQPSPSAAVKLDSPQSIALRLEQAGMRCVNLSPVSGPLNATARASCYVGTNEVVISTYASRVDVEAQWKLLSTTLAGISEVNLVLGDTWTILADDSAYAQKAAQLLGGEYRHSA